MKALILALATLPLLAATIGPIEKESKRIKVPEDSEIHIRVVLSYVGCSEESAMYQVFEDGSSKIVDLRQLDRNNPFFTHSSNSQKVHRILSEISQCDFHIKSLETKQNGECSYEMYYVLEDAALQSSAVSSGQISSLN